MDKIIKIQHRGIVGEALVVGSSVVIESCDANELCLRVAPLASTGDHRVASKKQHASDMAEMKEAQVLDQRKAAEPTP